MVTDAILSPGEAGGPAIPVHPVTPDTVARVLETLPETARTYAGIMGFTAEAGQTLCLPGDTGSLAAVLFGLGSANAPARSPLLPGKLAKALPAGNFRFDEGTQGLFDADDQPFDPRLATLAFALGAYRFDAYKKVPPLRSHLVAGPQIDTEEIRRITDGVYRARDLINRPANDLGPAELAGAVESLASVHGAKFHTVTGADLETEYPLVHAVGAASDRAPLLADMTWGDPAHPKITLVGKGVVFDTGGLDLKPAAGMALMKKDMGGAAATIGLASMIMDAGLPVRLRVLIPAVENAVSGRAFRPGDIFKSRKGLTVEIGNTDAEGRLVLADALARADEEAPDLLVSMATLTGAARVAVGPDLVPLFSHDDGFVADILASAEAQYDPVWRLPLWRPYDKWLDSKVADLSHIGGKAFAGASIAALFLNRFVDAGTTYAHFDIYGWAPEARPWAPAGGDAQAIRSLFDCLSRRYGKA